MTDAAAKTAALLKALWEKNLPMLRERVGVLSTAASAAASDGLDETLRVQAAGTAHKLAGSLGMFGYPQGTLVAREIEVVLTAEGPVDAARIGALVAQLKALLPL